jgi:hypothetical protein
LKNTQEAVITAQKTADQEVTAAKAVMFALELETIVHRRQRVLAEVTTTLGFKIMPYYLLRFNIMPYYLILF